MLRGEKMAGKVQYEKFFKNIKIKNPETNELIQLKFLANKVYLDNSKPTGDIFQDMILNGSAWTVRQEKDSKHVELVPSIDDRRFIELFFNHKEDYVRELAFKKIQNEYVLAYIAMNDENREFRWDAFSRVWNENLLEEIAKNSIDWELRLTIARYYLKSNRILKSIARNCPDPELRQRARELSKQWGPLNYKTYEM